MTAAEHKHAKKLMLEHLDALRDRIKSSTPEDIEQLTNAVLDIVAVYHSIVRPGTIKPSVWRDALRLLGWPPAWIDGKAQSEPKNTKLAAVLTEPAAKLSVSQQQRRERRLRKSAHQMACKSHMVTPDPPSPPEPAPRRKRKKHADLVGQLSFSWMDSLLATLTPDTGQSCM